MINEIRTLIRHMLLEDADDVVEVEARIRIRSSQRTVTDILTDIRGIKKVVTVSQIGGIQAAEDGKQRIIALIKFESGESLDLEGLEQNIDAIPEVDMITITAYDGETMRRVT